MGIIKINGTNIVSYTLQGETLLSAAYSTVNNVKCISIDGAVKTLVAPCLEEIIDTHMQEGTDFILDFEKVPYIASAGLRVLLNMQQKIDDEELINVRIINVTEGVRDVLESTGFINILDIDE